MADAADSKIAGQPAAHARHHELRNAENSAAFLKEKLHAMREINPALTLLDVGAGSGTISASFAKALPDGHVTAVDIKPDVLPRAKAVADMAGVKNIDFKQGDVKKLPFPDDSFDITFCHQMLTHIGSPEDGLREMLRVTKPGGVVAAREGDFESEIVWPQLPGLAKFHQFAGDLMRAAGGTTTAGRQLFAWALKAGAQVDDITLSFSTWSYHSPDERRIWGQALIDRVKTGPLREKGLKAGLTTEIDLAEMASDWETWINQLDANISMLHGEILIRK